MNIVPNSDTATQIHTYHPKRMLKPRFEQRSTVLLQCLHASLLSEICCHFCLATGNTTVLVKQNDKGHWAD